MVHQSNELSCIGVASQIQNISEWLVPVIAFSNLHKGNPSPEMIDDFLVKRRVPPFRGKIKLSARDDNPKGAIIAEFPHLPCPILLVGAEVNISLERSQWYPQLKLRL